MSAIARFETRLGARKPILAMLHLGGETRAERLARAAAEIDRYEAGGVDAIIVENYFGDIDDVRAVLDHLDEHPASVPVGLNVLRDAATAFELAARHDVAFIQMDSVSGHLPAEEDARFAEQLQDWRASTDALLLGGVRFKYQPVLSGRPEEDDLLLGKARCDAIVVTGEGTGMPTDEAKIDRFRQTLGAEFPLLIGAGVTAASVGDLLPRADGAIVGSAFKDTGTDTGVVDEDAVRAFMRAAAEARAA